MKVKNKSNKMPLEDVAMIDWNYSFKVLLPTVQNTETWKENLILLYFEEILELTGK